MNTKLFSHIESELGSIQGALKRSPEGEQQPFQVIKTAGGNLGGVSYATLGLSHFPLASPVGDKLIHQELFVSLEEDDGASAIPGIIQDIGIALLKTKRALLKGEVIGPKPGAVIKGTSFTAFYVTSPAYWSDDFAGFESDEHSAVMVWLVPITTAEAAFINTYGWNRFEDTLAASDLNMRNMNRAECLLNQL